MADKPTESVWGVIDIRGTAYHTVAKRVADFRKDHNLTSGWCIQTEIVSRDADSVLARASIIHEGITVATGHASERRDAMEGFMADSMLEVAETSAVGRALAFLGYGGHQSEIASADEMKRRGLLDAEEMSAKRTRETIESLVTKAEKEDFAGCLEVWEELSQGQMIWINQKMDPFNKRRVKDAIGKAIAARDGAVQPDISGAGAPVAISQKDQRRVDARAGK